MRKLKMTSEVNGGLMIPNEVITGPSTIMGAFEAVLQVINKSELNEEKLAEAKDSFEFLQEKLSVSTFQTILLAMLIDYVSPLQPRQMANFLGTSNIRILSLMPELNNLIDRNLVRTRIDHMDKVPAYELRKEVLNSYMQNQAIVPNQNSGLTLAALFDRLSEVYMLCDTDELDSDELAKEIVDIVDKNQRHEVCKLIKDRDSADKVLFMFLCTCYVTEGDKNVAFMQYHNYFSGFRSRSLSGSLSRGKHPLMQAGLIEFGGDDEFSNRDGVTISAELRRKLSVELNLDWESSNEEMYKKGLQCSNDIQPKSLFYNKEESESISRLTALLQEENYQSIRQRLADNGMRKGFACLFYGSPGTGKTETVLQLARTTGRDIMSVNISQIKSKWVGDTEKNIKCIFDRYRNYCDKCKLAPILLFNEADAVISNRSGNATSSVDKMENAMQNIILEEMERLDGILIATTNLTSNMDPAFERRFIYKIEFHKPEPSVKACIWQSALKDLTDKDARWLSDKYDFSGGQIENIVRKQMIDSILYDYPLDVHRLDEYCRMEEIHKTNSRTSITGFR